MAVPAYQVEIFAADLPHVGRAKVRMPKCGDRWADGSTQPETCLDARRSRINRHRTRSCHLHNR